MLIRTAISDEQTALDAINGIHAALNVRELGRPDFLALHFGAKTSATDLQHHANIHFKGAAIHGGSSCLGVMTNETVAMESGGATGAIAIWDPQGSYGSASAELGSDPTSAAISAAKAALDAAGRRGEIPDLVWLTVAPGREELVLEGLRQIVGAGTPIVGGSSADNDVSGQWEQFGPQAVHRDGVVISVMFPSGGIGSFYGSGYAPTGRSGIVTRAAGRRLFEIDGRPAVDVYQEWSNNAFPAGSDSATSILAAATYWPLGRVTRHVAGVPFHLLVHPAILHPDGSLDLFASVAEGDQLWQMHGSADSLVNRAPQIARHSKDTAAGTLAGAMIVYCGGCMLAVQDRMDEIRKLINSELDGAPWMGIFTFGEQGSPPGGQVKHGNLMISCTAFTEQA